MEGQHGRRIMLDACSDLSVAPGHTLRVQNVNNRCGQEANNHSYRGKLLIRLFLDK